MLAPPRGEMPAGAAERVVTGARALAPALGNRMAAVRILERCRLSALGVAA